MEYKKVNFTIDIDTEINRAILVAKLGELGFDSFTETEKTVEGYIPSYLFYKELISSESFPDYPFFTYNYSIETIPDQNWNEVWEKNYFQPLLIDQKCLIRAPFHTEYPKVQYEIIIEPKMSFGTGNHETTSLMISEMLSLNLSGKKVLDMGCGTGVLGILASLKGAEEITAIDIDVNAYYATLENTKYNNISNLNTILGGAEVLGNEKYDFIFANIQRNILLRDIPEYFKVLNRGGILMMSGFYLSDLPLIRQKAESFELEMNRYMERNNWIAATFALI